MPPTAPKRPTRTALENPSICSQGLPSSTLRRSIGPLLVAALAPANDADHGGEPVAWQREGRPAHGYLGCCNDEAESSRTRRLVTRTTRSFPAATKCRDGGALTGGS